MTEDLDKKALRHKTMVNDIYSKLEITKEAQKEWAEHVGSLKKHFTEIDDALNKILESMLDRRTK